MIESKPFFLILNTKPSYFWAILPVVFASTVDLCGVSLGMSRQCSEDTFLHEASVGQKAVAARLHVWELWWFAATVKFCSHQCVCLALPWIVQLDSASVLFCRIALMVCAHVAWRRVNLTKGLYIRTTAKVKAGMAWEQRLLSSLAHPVLLYPKSHLTLPSSCNLCQQ